MKFMPRKFHCPSFICFCKPSSHIYAPEPLKLENAPQVPSTVTSSVSVPGESPVQQSTEVKNGEPHENNPKESQVDGSVCIRSSLKKKEHERVEETEERMNKKKKVQWLDHSGMDLAEVREFDSRDDEELDYQGNRSNMCIIL